MSRKLHQSQIQISCFTAFTPRTVQYNFNRGVLVAVYGGINFLSLINDLSFMQIRLKSKESDLLLPGGILTTGYINSKAGVHWAGRFPISDEIQLEVYLNAPNTNDFGVSIIVESEVK